MSIPLVHASRQYHIFQRCALFRSMMNYLIFDIDLKNVLYYNFFQLISFNSRTIDRRVNKLCE